MGKVSENREKHDQSADNTVANYVSSMDNEHKMLVILKTQLYGGSWEPMLEDLQNRLQGKPYIFKLANRIKNDVDRIREMQVLDQENTVDLADSVELT